MSLHRGHLVDFSLSKCFFYATAWSLAIVALLRLPAGRPLPFLGSSGMLLIRTLRICERIASLSRVILPRFGAVLVFVEAALETGSFFVLSSFTMGMMSAPSSLESMSCGISFSSGGLLRLLPRVPPLMLITGTLSDLLLARVLLGRCPSDT